MPSLPVERRVAKWKSRSKEISKVSDFDQVWSVRKDAPSLQSMTWYMPYEEVCLEMAAIMNECNRKLSDRRKLSAEHILLACEMILNEFSNWNITEIAYVFNEAIKGRYGDTFGEADVMTVMQWFRQHEQDRTGWIEAKRLQLQNKSRAINKVPFHKDIAGKIAKMFPDPPNVEEVEDAPTKGMTYKSIKHYCEVNNIDYKPAIQEYRDMWKVQYDNNREKLSGITYEQYERNEAARLLFDLNNESK